MQLIYKIWMELPYFVYSSYCATAPKNMCYPCRVSISFRRSARLFITCWSTMEISSLPASYASHASSTDQSASCFTWGILPVTSIRAWGLSRKITRSSSNPSGHCQESVCPTGTVFFAIFWAISSRGSEAVM